MNAQLSRMPEWLEYFGGIAATAEGYVPPFASESHVNYCRPLPLGVCGLITPWNHPLLIAVKKISPALAAGNSVVVKPSELAPVSVLLFAQLLEEAGVPSGVVNVLPGYGLVAGQGIM